MNTRRALVLILIIGLLGLHTVYTRMSSLDYSLRTGQLYSSEDRLKEQKRELEVNLSILRQPVAAIEKASQYCPNLEPAHPELAAYHLHKDRPQLAVPSLKLTRPATPPAPPAVPAVPVVAPLDLGGVSVPAAPVAQGKPAAASVASPAAATATVPENHLAKPVAAPAASLSVNRPLPVIAPAKPVVPATASPSVSASAPAVAPLAVQSILPEPPVVHAPATEDDEEGAVDSAVDPSEDSIAPAQGMRMTPGDPLACANTGTGYFVNFDSSKSVPVAVLVPASVPHHVN